MSKYTSLSSICFYLVALVFCVSPLFTLASQSTADVTFSLGRLIKDSALIGSAIYMILIVTVWTSASLFSYSLTKNLLIALCIFITFNVFNPIPNAGGSDMRGLNHTLNVYSLFVNIFATLVFYLLVIGKFKVKALVATSLVLLTSYLTVFNHQKFKQQNVEFHVELGDQNLIVFSFDGVPGITMNNLASTFDDFPIWFKDFTLYESTVAHSPSTIASVYSEIFGAFNWKSIAKTEAELIAVASEKFNDTTQTWYLDNAYLYGEYSKHAQSSSITAKNHSDVISRKKIDKTFASLPFISSSLCRTGFCLLGKKYGRFEKYVRKALFIVPLFGIQLENQNQGFDFLAFEDIITETRKVDKNYGSFFGHFDFSHAPIMHDEQCVFFERPLPELEANVSRQTACVVTVMMRIIEKLKEKDLYENSLIVFKSDHGKPVEFFDETNLRGLKIFNSDNKLGYDRYRPFSMIKLPRQNSNRLNLSDEMFYLSELSQVYCQSYSMFNRLPKPECNSISLVLEEEFGLAKGSDKYLYVPKGSNSFKFDDHEAVINGRSIDEMELLFRSWVID